ncbi:glycosyltransferase [bacterium]|nr:MAG: glycosyltransferase [bacterium]
MNPRFTFLTCTYNRAHTLERPWRSIRAQTVRDFEWVVVDDGSTDETTALLQSIQAEADFPVRIFRQANQGKQIAWNLGVSEARGRYLVGLDSDDECVPTTIEAFGSAWDSVDVREDASTVSTVVSLCRSPEGEIIGDLFPTDPFVTDSIRLRLGDGIQGEKFGCLRTDVAREFPYTPSPDTKYIPEDIIWFRIARRYKLYCINEALRIYYTDAPSLVTGVKPSRHAASNVLSNGTFLNEHSEVLTRFPKGLFMIALRYARFSYHLNKGLGSQLAGVRPAAAKAAVLAASPAGYALYRRDVAKERKG